MQSVDLGSAVRSPSHLLYAAAGLRHEVGSVACWFCGKPCERNPMRIGEGWPPATFNDAELARCPQSQVVCAPCRWAMSFHNAELTARVVRPNDQRMPNYSHIVTAEGEWLPLTKRDRGQMAEHVLSIRFPRLAMLAESGQIHLIGRARVNPPGSVCGWVTLERSTFWVDPPRLAAVFEPVQALYHLGFSRSDIAAGTENDAHIMRVGYHVWAPLHAQVAAFRGTPLLPLAVFLATRKECNP